MLNREFVKSYYNEAYRDVCFITCPIDIFIEYLSSIGTDFYFDTLIIDPGDIVIINQSMLQMLQETLILYKCNLICTSQIRQIPEEGGKPYSTLDRLNKRYCKYGKPLFDFSVWIRNITEHVMFYNNKYIEVYRFFRYKNNFIERVTVKYSKEGYIVKEAK
jgi:hypothetical protein